MENDFFTSTTFKQRILIPPLNRKAEISTLLKAKVDLLLVVSIKNRDFELRYKIRYNL